MYVVSKQFWKDFRHSPKEAIDTLQEAGSKIAYPVISFLVFWRITFSEYFLNHCITRASALAFDLLFTLIPLMATASFMVANFIELRPDDLIHLLSRFLPFAPQEILNQLSSFIENAQKLRGIGIILLIVITIGLFGTVEESLNTIWKVARSRSLFIRVRTFTMVMVYSPILFFVSFQFRHSLLFDTPSRYSIAWDLLPFILSVFAFTTLTWLVPNTKVKFKNALLGGLVAGILFEAERQGFGAYVRMSIQTQAIYGSFGILVLFLASIFFLSLFVLFGSEVSYVRQNFRPLLRAKKRFDRRIGDYRTYIVMRIMIDIITGFHKKTAPPTLSQIVDKYELTDPQARGIMNFLLGAGLVHCLNETEAYVPTHDYTDVCVKVIMDAIEDESRRIPTTPKDFTRDYLAELMNLMKQPIPPSIEKITFQRLIAEVDQGELPVKKAHKK